MDLSRDAARVLLPAGRGPDPATPAGRGTALIAAARRGDCAALVAALEAGADPGYCGAAAGGGGAGADGGRWVRPEARVHGEATALHHAASLGHVGAVRALLAAGAAVDARTRYGSSPLHYAAHWGFCAAAAALLEHGARPPAAARRPPTREPARVRAVRSVGRGGLGS